MLERRVTLFRLLGFSVRLHYSWLLLGLLIAWSLAEFWFKPQIPDMAAGLRWTLGGVGAIGLLFSIVFHELSHSVVARRHGIPIRGIEAAEEDPEVAVFHAGTKRDESGEFVTAGGRVLGVTARGSSLAEAVERAYGAVDRIHFEGMHVRRGIAKRALPR